jgi:hypothetical protein
MTTAAHVLSPCWRLWTDQANAGVEGDSDCPEGFYDPKVVPAEAKIQLASVGGGQPMARWSAHFSLYNLFIPSGALGSASILPRHDVSVYVVDSQVFEAWGTGLGVTPDPVVDAPLALHDPAGLTVAVPTWREAQPGTPVVLLGFPAFDSGSRALHASIGQVLADEEAAHVIATLRSAGDEEGVIPYDPEAEVLIEMPALPGMSGGGIYDEQGMQVAIAVRASSADIGVQYVRAARMSHLVRHMDSSFTSLQADTQSRVSPYLESL